VTSVGTACIGRANWVLTPLPLPRAATTAARRGLPDRARRAASTHRIEPVTAELLLAAVVRARATASPRRWGRPIGVQWVRSDVGRRRWCNWQSRWQSDDCHHADRYATRQTADSTRPAAMRPGSTSRTARVLLLIREVQVRALPGALKPQVSALGARTCLLCGNPLALTRLPSDVLMPVPMPTNA